MINGTIDKKIWEIRLNFIEVAERCKGKSLADLTNDEKLAIAIMAGVKINVRPTENSGHFYIQTEPCGIAEDGKGGFIVASNSLFEQNRFR